MSHGQRLSDGSCQNSQVSAASCTSVPLGWTTFWMLKLVNIIHPVYNTNTFFSMKLLAEKAITSSEYKIYILLLNQVYLYTAIFENDSGVFTVQKSNYVQIKFRKYNYLHH